MKQTAKSCSSIGNRTIKYDLPYSQGMTSMKVGFLGLGKLGLPCALALDDAGHQVFGYDISQETMKNIANKVLPYREAVSYTHLRAHET